MGVFKRFFKEFTEDQDEYVDDYENEIDEEEEEEVRRVEPQEKPAQAQRSSVSMSSSALEMKVVKPVKYEEVTQIAEYLLQRHTLVLNLEDTNKDTIKRIIDFLSGVVFAIRGDIKRVANSTYIVTPSGVNVSGDQMAETVEKTTNAKELF